MQQQHSNHFDANFDDARTPLRLVSSLFNAVLATALFRCWHILIFFAAWATAVSLINHSVRSFSFQPTLLTVIGTVLGFVISYRTTSSFERYNEGRRYWSQIILASRTLARAVWFHVPELPSPQEKEKASEDERRARVMIEKKTVINLIEAFSVAVKHYLRGEEGINYVDLYHLVKFLPSYSFPTGIPAPAESTGQLPLKHNHSRRTFEEPEHEKIGTRESHDTISSKMDGETDAEVIATSANEATKVKTTGAHITLPAPVTASGPRRDYRSQTSLRRSVSNRSGMHPRAGVPQQLHSHISAASYGFADDEEVVLQPASMPPKFAVFDIFPLSLFIKLLEKKGKSVEGRKAARYRAKSVVVTRNVPLEISMYLTSYVSALQHRKCIDVPTTNLLIATVNQLTDALTGLERILTTPIPFSYSIHLWLVTLIYCMALPLQIWPTLKWITIPATVILAFIFFGFLVAGEEIENPFGYDKNDLNMDHFTHNIIRNELLALTAFPPPAPGDWAFSPKNDMLFVPSDLVPVPGEVDVHTVTPEEWVHRGTSAIKEALTVY